MSRLLDPPGTRAPEWRVSEWIGDGAPRSLGELRGRVVAIHAFQLLCPGCVQHGIPQAKRIRATFPAAEVAVIGLHAVFEHHEAMGPAVLRAFLFENRVSFPVGIDHPSATAGDPLPCTMRTWGLQGTPSLLLVDRNGDLRRHAFGAEDDMTVGAAIAALVAGG